MGHHWTRAYVTNKFVMTNQIEWKFRFDLIQVLTKVLLQNFVHGTTAVLCQKCNVMMFCQELNESENITLNFNCDEKGVIEISSSVSFISLLGNQVWLTPHITWSLILEMFN